MQLLMGDELRELIKGFLARLEEDGSTFSMESIQRIFQETSGDSDDPLFWLKALRWCPRELLDLVNSKACRGGFSMSRLMSAALTLSQER